MTSRRTLSVLLASLLVCGACSEPRRAEKEPAPEKPKIDAPEVKGAGKVLVRRADGGFLIEDSKGHVLFQRPQGGEEMVILVPGHYEAVATTERGREVVDVKRIPFMVEDGKMTVVDLTK